MRRTDLAGRKILKVYQLAAQIRAAAEREFSDVWVEGEVADLRMPPSGHLYFTLKDATAQMKAIIFRAHGRFLKFTPKEGKLVLIRGHLTFYEARGEYQLIVDYIEPKGIGLLQAAFEALKEKLRREGLFNEDRKKPIPRLPSRIGLVTSPSGAALQDILRVLRGNGLSYHITIYPVSVQGEGAAGEIARGIEAFNDALHHPSPARRVDLLILARGGGSLEDLAAFNEEGVARAIARSEIPVITGIGHETDTTISDYAADLSAPTPSIAAEMIARNGLAVVEQLTRLDHALSDRVWAKIEGARTQLRIASRLLTDPTRRITHVRDRLRHLMIRLQQALDRSLEERRGRWVRCRQGLFHLNPIDRLHEFRREVDQLSGRFVKEGRGFIEREKNIVHAQMEQLHLLSPLNILSRGYSIAQKLPTLKIVRDAEEIERDDRLRLTFHRGSITCSVIEKEPAAPEEEN
ncbi:MAG: exodeoxyribonuclease VII large subunit [Nitrospiria bacterium]